MNWTTQRSEISQYLSTSTDNIRVIGSNSGWYCPEIELIIPLSSTTLLSILDEQEAPELSVI